MKKNTKSAFGLGKPIQIALLIGSVILFGIVLWGVQNGTFELRQQAAGRAWPTVGASITCHNADKTVKGDCTYCTEYKCTKKKSIKGMGVGDLGQKVCLEGNTKTGVCVGGTCVTDGSAGETCPLPSGVPADQQNRRRLE